MCMRYVSAEAVNQARVNAIGCGRGVRATQWSYTDDGQKWSKADDDSCTASQDEHVAENGENCTRAKFPTSQRKGRRVYKAWPGRVKYHSLCEGWRSNNYEFESNLKIEYLSRNPVWNITLSNQLSLVFIRTLTTKMEFSKTYQYRKVMKPLLERKRRARINKCLDDLKELMVECLTQEGEHIVRLEKADILELTVDYLKKVKTRKSQPSAESFRTGYKYAVNEVSKVLASTPDVNIQLGTMLMTNLGHRLNQLLQGLEQPQQQQSPQSYHVNHQQQYPQIRSQTTVAPSSTCSSPAVSPSSKEYSLPPSPASSSSGYESDTSSEISVCSTTSVWRPW